VFFFFFFTKKPAAKKPNNEDERKNLEVGFFLCSFSFRKISEKKQVK